MSKHLIQRRFPYYSERPRSKQAIEITPYFWKGLYEACVCRVTETCTGETWFFFTVNWGTDLDPHRLCSAEAGFTRWWSRDHKNEEEARKECKRALIHYMTAYLQADGQDDHPQEAGANRIVAG